ncbi:site-specific integrase [Micrococcus sp.]|uniref:tyrosine-type recombinase/integrase n=1 Tax=Micrococcus sp. TaxID=1271 RepID=UPI002A913347|nr:site-specific integrase [Micrococcus sp.]MDY6054379.1 site-specific integrase [Micrococcus sp.]
MSRVQDLWHRRDRTRTSRYGKGNRWRAIRTDGSGAEASKTFPTKDAATAWAHAADAPAAHAPVTVAEWAEEWQRRQVHQRPSSRGVIRMRVTGDVVPTLGALRLGAVTRADVQAAVLAWQDRGLAPSTIRLSYSYLSSMLRDAALEGLIPASPAKQIRLPRSAAEPVPVLTVEQVQQIADRVDPWARDAVILAAATGMRPGEWRGLTVDRVDLGAGTILVDRQAGEVLTSWAPLKTVWSRRTITVGPATLEVLERLVAAAGPLGHLHHHEGKAWSRKRVNGAWVRVRRRLDWMGAGGWHLLRHHHASHLLSQGASVVAVARRLGHKDATELLQTYAHVLPSDDVALARLSDGAVR